MRQVFHSILSLFLSIALLVTQTGSLLARTNEVILPSIDESVFDLDEVELDLEMEQLNKLENYLDHNDGISFSDLINAESELIINISNKSNPMGMMQAGEPPLGIPSFLWGCVLGVAGLLVVYIVTDSDKAEVKKAFMGCLVGGAVILASYGVAILVQLNSI